MSQESAFGALPMARERIRQHLERSPSAGMMVHPDDLRALLSVPDVHQAASVLLEAAERHIFSTECQAERDALRQALQGHKPAFARDDVGVGESDWVDAGNDVANRIRALPYGPMRYAATECALPILNLLMARAALPSNTKENPDART